MGPLEKKGNGRRSEVAASALYREELLWEPECPNSEFLVLRMYEMMKLGK